MQIRNAHIQILTLFIASCLAANAQPAWRELPPPTTHDLRRLVFLDSARGWVSGLNGAILRTTNGGMTWQTQQSGVSSEIHELFFLNDRLGWALTWTDFVDTLTWFGTNILKTTNGGAVWTRTQFPTTGEFFSAIHFHDSLNGLMAGGFGRIVRTTNGGVPWIPAVIDSSPVAQWAIRRFRFFSRNYGYAMGGRLDIVGVVWKTTNGGQRWRAEGISPEPVRDLYFLDSLNIVGVAGDLDFGASMVSTKNAGILWEYQFLQIFGEPAAISFRTKAEAWSPLGFAGVFITTRDTGRTWSVVEAPRRRPTYDVTFSDSLTGYAVGDSGMVLKFGFPTSVTERANDVPPSECELQQNSPNPFNPVTNFGFRIADFGLVTVRVFDVLGREVATLVNEVREAGGYEIHFDASNLSSGVYLYRLQAGRFVATRKMLVVR
jgi:photosystem II stability/assembly factor-like uncharacterized protein